DGAGVHLDGEDRLPSLGVPHLHLTRFVCRLWFRPGRGEALAVGAEAQAGDLTGVALEGELLLARVSLPHLHPPVETSRGEAFEATFRRKTSRVERHLVAPVASRLTFP